MMFGKTNRYFITQLITLYQNIWWCLRYSNVHCFDVPFPLILKFSVLKQEYQTGMVQQFVKRKVASHYSSYLKIGMLNLSESNLIPIQVLVMYLCG